MGNKLYLLTHIRPQLVNKNLKKNQLRLSFSGSLLFFEKNGVPVQNKKQSLYRNSKKDSRKSVLNQTHIVDHGKPEKQIEEVKKIHQKDLDEGFEAVSLPNALDSKYPSGSKELKWQ